MQPKPEDAAMFLETEDTKNWFVNEEERIFKGNDYETKIEDMHRLIRYLKTNLAKTDFLRYETEPDTQ